MAKIIAVDDSMEDLKLVESVLANNHRVILCQDGTNVEDRVSTEQPDLLLLDVVMPQRNGYEILRKLKRDEKMKHIPVMVISSKGNPTDIEWGKRQGADAYLVKPYTPEALNAAVNGLLRK